MTALHDTLETTRQRLTRAAAELFYQQGIRRTSVDEVVARAGFTKPTLYQHFRSKDELIESALELRDREHRQRLLALRDGESGSPRDQLLIAFDLLEKWLDEGAGFRGCALINAAIELPDPKHPGRKVVRRHKAWLRHFLEQTARDAGVSDPEGLAEALLFLIEGATMSGYVQGGRRVGPAARQAALALLDAWGL